MRLPWHRLNRSTVQRVCQMRELFLVLCIPFGMFSCIDSRSRRFNWPDRSRQSRTSRRRPRKATEPDPSIRRRSDALGIVSRSVPDSAPVRPRTSNRPQNIVGFWRSATIPPLAFLACPWIYAPAIPNPIPPSPDRQQDVPAESIPQVEPFAGSRSGPRRSRVHRVRQTRFARRFCAGPCEARRLSRR